MQIILINIGGSMSSKRFLIGHSKGLPFQKTVLSVACSSLMGLSGAVYADSNTVNMDTLIIVDQVTSDVDGQITDDQISATQANDMSDIFSQDAAVSAGGSVQMSQKIYVRNIGEDNLNVTIDGAEQAGAVFHHSGRISIEPELLKRVDIETGAGEATSGFGALGGSVHFVTKDPSDLLKDGERAGALVKSTYFDNGDGFKNSVTVFGQNESENLGGMLSLSRSDLDDLNDGNGDTIDGTADQKTLGYGKIVGYLSDDQYASLSYESVDEEGDILYKPDLVASARNVAEPTKAQRDTIIFNYDYTPAYSDAIDLSVNVYHTKNKQAREFRSTEYSGYVRTFGATIENTSLLGDHALTYGVNYRNDKSYLNDVDVAPTRFDETGKVWGLYLQDHYTLNDEWSLSGGVRFDDYEITDVENQTLSDNGFSFNAGARYQFTPEWGASLGYAEALRGPEVKDAFKLSSSTNDANLKAETSKNIELGFDYQSQGFSFASGVFYSRIYDPIGGTVPWSRVYENLDDAIESTGFYARAGMQWDALSVSASLISADTEADGEPVTRYVYSSGANSIGDTLTFDTRYQMSPEWMMGWSAEFVRGIHNINLNVGGDQLKLDKPGYGIHDLYVHWKPMGDDQLKVALSVNNIFDKQYLSHASVENFTGNAGWEGIVGSPESGRDVRLSVSARF
jgi:hemoglobin/transferrin/lactoferrin receptor protein